MEQITCWFILVLREDSWVERSLEEVFKGTDRRSISFRTREACVRGIRKVLLCFAQKHLNRNRVDPAKVETQEGLASTYGRELEYFGEPGFQNELTAYLNVRGRTVKTSVTDGRKLIIDGVEFTAPPVKTTTYGEWEMVGRVFFYLMIPHFHTYVFQDEKV